MPGPEILDLNAIDWLVYVVEHKWTTGIQREVRVDWLVLPSISLVVFKFKIPSSKVAYTLVWAGTLQRKS